MTQVVAPIVIAPVKQCHLNKGYRKMLKKSKSSTKFSSMKRHPLAEVSTNCKEDMTDDQAAQQSHEKDFQEVRINILASSKNSAFEDDSKIPRGGDNTPLTEGFESSTTSNTKIIASQK